MSQATPDTPHFVHSFDLETRWGDMDALKHVNNALYLVYLQEARLDWIKALAEHAAPGDSWLAGHTLVASSEINYHRPITWPATVRIDIYCERIGNSSATLSYRLTDVQDPACLYAECRTVMVWIDPESFRPAAIPKHIRASLGG